MCEALRGNSATHLRAAFMADWELWDMCMSQMPARMRFWAGDVALAKRSAVICVYGCCVVGNLSMPLGGGCIVL